MDEVRGLRARKRLAAMHRIQAAALDLFDERGYEAVTVEQIAEASEVSPSTVYRYFGAKEQLVLWDEWDPQVIERMLDGLADVPPLDAARAVLIALMVERVADNEEQLRRRVQHMMSEPALEAASARLVLAGSELAGEMLAARLGRPHVDLQVQVFAHALVGGVLGAIHHWHGTQFREPLRDVLEQCFDVFGAGLAVGGLRASSDGSAHHEPTP